MEKERKYYRKSAFVNGVAVGFGIGCFATFAALLVTAFYYSQTTNQTFEIALSNFSFPVSYFFILGLLFLVIGYVWERFEKQLKL
jgi:xanthine/uracil/vitamin C permease (AzgA family)